jgi:hypothetical protein
MQRTSPQLAGFFGSDFWERLILQAAYHESAVRHAIVAIGSVHEQFEHQTAMVDVNRVFALEQYNLAIRGLLVPLSQSGKRGVDVCLISCILFTCFEVRPILYMVVMSCRYPLIYADYDRICKGTIPQQHPISKAARSYCVELCMTSGMEYSNTKCLGQKMIGIPTLH